MVRLDPTHVRVTLIEVEIILQHLSAVAATDILSGESLSARSGRIALRIPAGTPRIVDLAHS